MNNKIILIIVLIMVWLFSIQINESNAIFEKTPVEIVTTSNDIVGQKLISKIREDMGHSASLKITADKKEPRLKVTIVTLDPGSDKFKGNWTIYSLVISYCAGTVDTFITQYVGMTSDNETKNASERMVLIINDARYYYENYNKLPDYGQLMEIIGDLRNNLTASKKQLEEERSKSWWQKLWGG